MKIWHIQPYRSKHFKWNGSEYDDKGQVTVTELIDGRTIADVRISMYGNPSLNYNYERFIPDDSVAVASGEFFLTCVLTFLRKFDGTIADNHLTHIAAKHYVTS